MTVTDAVGLIKRSIEFHRSDFRQIRNQDGSTGSFELLVEMDLGF